LLEPRENPLAYEIAREQAGALGRLGRALEQAIAALAEFDQAARALKDNAAAADVAPAGPTRAELVRRASDALWCFVVQREACGLRDARAVLRDYRVPAEVHHRMGVFGKIPQR
jgi:hypothetical protein